MTDLENNLDEDDDYETSTLSITSSLRSQPKRTCKDKPMDQIHNDSCYNENSDGERIHHDTDLESIPELYESGKEEDSDHGSEIPVDSDGCSEISIEDLEEFYRNN